MKKIIDQVRYIYLNNFLTKIYNAIICKIYTFLYNIYLYLVYS